MLNFDMLLGFMYLPTRERGGGFLTQHLPGLGLLYVITSGTVHTHRLTQAAQGDVGSWGIDNQEK